MNSVHFLKSFPLRVDLSYIEYIFKQNCLRSHLYFPYRYFVLLSVDLKALITPHYNVDAKRKERNEVELVSIVASSFDSRLLSTPPCYFPILPSSHSCSTRCCTKPEEE